MTCRYFRLCGNGATTAAVFRLLFRDSWWPCSRMLTTAKSQRTILRYEYRNFPRFQSERPFGKRGSQRYILSVTDAALLSERRGWPGSEPGEQRRAQTHHYSVNGSSLLVLPDLDYCCYNKLRRQHANSCLANRPVALVPSYLPSLSCGSEQHIDPASQLLPSPKPRKASRLDLSRKHILFLRIRDQGGPYGTARSSQLPPPMARSIRMDTKEDSSM
jgi:hypothetical protein